MKVEFNTRNFSSSINCENDFRFCDKIQSKERALKWSGAAVFGVIALIISVITLALGFFMNFLADILSKRLNINLTQWITLIAVFSFSFIAVSTVCGILGIISYTKSPKGKNETVGFVLSIVAFAMNLFCIATNILSFL